MPRPGPTAASTLRNRNRINNKSRLKIVQGNIDTDPIIPDEDEEKNRLLQSVAGVDQEDANEHHLQAVLSEAALRNHSSGRATRGGDKDKEPAAFIPIPDSTGRVANYEEYYPPSRWKDPVSYVMSSLTVEESSSAALANGFTYFMDERAKEWLDKNNEEARGEGTSVQGAVSISGTRTSRSAKAKGKEPETQSVIMSEDEFELVMGLFEKFAHENTEFLHHALQHGMDFPPFSDYQDAFASTLPASTFAMLSPPPWLPPPQQLVRIARAVYPYWKERRLERGGHRIIPTLNFDEEDKLNESYVCFRRRESKAVRKTRASQVSSSEKLARLRAELNFPLELAKAVLLREQCKLENTKQSQAVWGARVKFVEFKRQSLVLGDKSDEELLFDKERPSRKEPRPGVRIPAKETGAQPLPVNLRADSLRPHERCQSLQSKTEALLEKQKELDQQWEDNIDSGYTSPWAPYSSRLFKYVAPPNAPSRSTQATTPTKRPVRLRLGRGGRSFVDRRFSRTSSTVPKRTRRRISSDSEDDESEPMDVDAPENDEEADRRLAERWRFDNDDGPAYGPGGSEEQDRVLVDDHSVGYMKHTMTLLAEQDMQLLANDPTLIKFGPDGRRETVIPFKIGIPFQRNVRYPSTATGQPSAQAIPAVAGMAPAVGTPVSISQQLKLHPAPKISGNGGLSHMRPVTAAATPTVSPPSQQRPPVNGIMNGINRPAMNMPHVDATKSTSPESITRSLATSPLPAKSSNASSTSPDVHMNTGAAGGSNGQASNSENISLPQSQQNHRQTSQPPQSTTPHLNGVNGNPHMSGYSPSLVNNTLQSPPVQGYSIPHTSASGSALSPQQVQNLKSVLNASSGGGNTGPQDFNLLQRQIQQMHARGQTSYINMYGMKLPPARQTQWTAGNGQGGTNSNAWSNTNSTTNPRSAVTVPVRTPSTNGTRTGITVGVNGQMPQQQQQLRQQQMSPPHRQMSPHAQQISPHFQG
ncbi:Enhancer of polycomb-like protein 1 [Stygiomarasmius scandens]|uniref:Enhancer of polycomb-like protein n=1 Tax=Marasmiellus scandens TaxID=2682957 RepID=A0ABR1K0Q0_9AGAR